ncbi:MAG: hypothetical protein UIG59_04125 [Acutalibacteraceae bacterium]|nr:hypothetical protein [Acutalibacteraceae bacterium]
MKKLIAVLTLLAVFACFGLNVMAAGTDDGTLLVATKDAKKYLGTEIAENLVRYVAADGADLVFYDVNADKDMNVCDLVALHNKSVDFDLSGTYDAADAAELRAVLIGETN